MQCFFLLQRDESASTVERRLPRYGAVTVQDIISVTHVVSTIKWTDKIDHSSNQNDDWWV